jgi:hypothetical protein
VFQGNFNPTNLLIQNAKEMVAVFSEAFQGEEGLIVATPTIPPRWRARERRWVKLN